MFFLTNTLYQFGGFPDFGRNVIQMHSKGLRYLNPSENNVAGEEKRLRMRFSQ